MMRVKKILKRREPQNIEYQKKKLKIVLIVIVVFGVVLLMVGNIGSIKLPLPENERGIKVMQGQITSCNILSLGKGGQMYVGIQLDNKTRLLELNALKYSWDKFQSMCDKKMRIKVTYHAERLILRPRISYTVDLIKRLPSNVPLYNRDGYESRYNKLMNREFIFAILLAFVTLVLFLIRKRKTKTGH